MSEKKYAVIELIVKNHPGVMSHITGLFSRRSFNLEGILCGEIGDGSRSTIYLLVKLDYRIDQIFKQLQKLYDVVDLSMHEDYDYTVFSKIDKMIKG